MKELDIKISYSCNNFCIFCLNKDKRNYGEFPILVLKDQIEKSAKAGGEKVIISGGEPLISPYFFELLVFIKEQGIRQIEVQTNGRMLYYEELVKKINKFQPIGFLVSLHFPTPDLYKKYCKSDGFYQVVGGIKNLVKYKCNFTVNIVVMKPNLPYLKDLIVLLKNLGVTKIQYRFIDGKNIMERYKEFVPKYTEVTSIIKETIKENPDINISVNEIPVCVLGEKFKDNVIFLINPNRLNLSTRNQLFTSKEIINKQFIHPNCKKCVYVSTCPGIRREYYQIYGDKELKPIEK